MCVTMKAATRHFQIRQVSPVIEGFIRASVPISAKNLRVNGVSVAKLR